MWNRLAAALVVTVALTGSVAAQSQSTAGAGSSTQTQSSTPQPAGGQSQTATPPMSADVETRPATTTFLGDTGLWYVPTGEVLPARRWSISAYRVNFDDNQGFTDV